MWVQRPAAISDSMRSTVVIDAASPQGASGRRKTLSRGEGKSRSRWVVRQKFVLAKNAAPFKKAGGAASSDISC